MPTIGRELPAELGVQVDLVVGALEREPDGLVGWAAGQVVFKDDGYFLGHVFTFPPSIVPARTVAVPCDREQRHGQAPADLRTRLDKHFRRQLYQCSYAQLLVLMDASAHRTAGLAPFRSADISRSRRTEQMFCRSGQRGPG